MPLGLFLGDFGDIKSHRSLFSRTVLYTEIPDSRTSVFAGSHDRSLVFGKICFPYDVRVMYVDDAIDSLDVVHSRRSIARGSDELSAVKRELRHAQFVRVVGCPSENIRTIGSFRADERLLEQANAEQ